MRNIVGIGLNGDTRNFVRGMNKAVSSVVSINHQVNQGERFFNNYSRAIRQTNTDLVKLDRRISKLRYNQALSVAGRMSDPVDRANMSMMARARYKRTNLALQMREDKIAEEAAFAAQQATYKDNFTKLGWVAAGAFVAGWASFSIADKIYDSLNGKLGKAADFQREMYKTAFVGEIPLDSPEFKALKKSSLQTAMRTMFSPSDIAKSYYSLIAAGLSQAEAERAKDPVANLGTLASFENMTLDDTAEMVAIFLQKARIPDEIKAVGKEAEWATDILARFINLSPGGLKDLRSMLDSSNVAMKTLNMSTEEQMTLMAIGRKTGLSRRRTGMALSALFPSITKAMRDQFQEEGYASQGAKARTEAWNLLGVSKDTFMSASGDMRKEFEILFDLAAGYDRVLKEKGQGPAEAILGKALTNERQQMFVRLLSTFEHRGLTGAAAFNELLKEMSQHQGVATKGAEQYLKTWEGAKKLLFGVIETIDTLLGDSLIDALTSAVNLFIIMLAEFATFLEANPFIAKLITGFLVLVLVISLIAGVVLMVAGGIAAIFAIFSAAATAIAAVTDVLAIAVVAFILLGVIATPFIIALVAGFKKAEPALKRFAAGIDALGNAFSKVTWDGKNFLISEDLARKMEDSGVWEFFKSTMMFLARLKFMWQVIKAVTAKAFVVLQDTGKGLIEAFIELFDAILGTKFGREGLGFWEKLGIGIGVALDFLLHAIAGVVSVFTLFIRLIAWFVEKTGPALYYILLFIAAVAVAVFVGIAAVVWAITMLYALVGLFFLAIAAVVVGILVLLYMAATWIYDFFTNFTDRGKEAGMNAGKAITRGVADGIISEMGVLGSALNSLIDFTSSFLPDGTNPGSLAAFDAGSNYANSMAEGFSSNALNQGVFAPSAGIGGGAGLGGPSPIALPQQAQRGDTNVNVTIPLTVNGSLADPATLDLLVAVLTKKVKESMENGLVDGYA